jgi:glutaredoxin
VAREFLSRNGVVFVEKNVREDPVALRELIDDHQSRSTPTLVIDETVLRGFEPGVVSRLLGLK